MSLNALSIAARVYAGFAVVLALLAGLAVFTVNSMTTADEVSTDFGVTVAQTLAVGEAYEGLAEAEMAHFLHDAQPTEANATELRTSIDEVARRLKHAVDFFDGADEAARRTALEGAIADVERFREAARIELDAETRRQALMTSYQDALEKVSAEVEAVTEMFKAAEDYQGAFLAADFGQRLQRARAWRTRFMLTGDETAHRLAEDAAGRYREALDVLKSRMTAPALARRAETIVAQIGEIRTTLKALDEAVIAREAADATIVDDIGPKMAGMLDRLHEETVAEQETLSAATTEVIDATRLTASWLGGGAVALGLALAVLLGRWIAKAVAAMAESMGRIAGGDLDAPVTGDGYEHELGRMAKALKVFQDNGREMRRLDAEKQAQASRDAAAAAERAALQSAVQAVVEKASDGDFRPRVEARFADEGLNAFARLTNGLLDTVSNGVAETARVMAALARGDLSARMEGAYHGAFAELKQNVNSTVERLGATVRDIRTASASIRSATGEIASGAENLSGRAENQAASLEEIAATMEEMSATVKTNAENATSASSLAADASARADQGGAIVAKAVTAMARIEEGSGKIADIVTVIDGFAFQTNLLALNAAVEAARAGEAGKGFAVVASEVRTLAQRSAEAARDIKALIQDSSVQVADGVKLVEDTGAALRAIVEAIRKVSETIVEISEASREQSSGVDEITAAITSMDEITQQNSALADESASSAKGLADQAAKLEALVGFFAVAARNDGEAAFRPAARAA
jgi:methyl-accepting chemotaxis protein